MNKTIIQAALVATLSLSALAQAQTAVGYLTDSRGAVVKSGTGLCWRTNYWTPALAIADCDADLAMKAAPPATAVKAPAAAPAVAAPAAAPAAPKPISVVLKGSLFDFNKAILKPAAKAQLDAEVVAKIKELGSVKQINIAGHSDRIGKPAYNQKLSEKRAEAVKAYLVSKGIDGKLVETFGYGATQPAQGVAKCDDKLARKALIACLEPHRRVVVEIQPAAK